MRIALPKQRKTEITARVLSLLLICIANLACNSSPTLTGVSRHQAKPTPGFLDQMINQVTTRECNVGNFTCPFGMGAAGEPCDCTDPSGVIRNGRTVK
jgi:hypothetical protein